MPDLGSTQKTGDEKIAELENYLIQLRDQIGWELDRLRARIDELEKTVQVLAEQNGENGGALMMLYSMIPPEEPEPEEPQEEETGEPEEEGGGEDA